MKQSMFLLAAAALFSGIQAGANVKMPTNSHCVK